MGHQWQMHDYHATRRRTLDTRRPDAADRLAHACTRVLQGAAAFGGGLIVALLVTRL